MNNLNKKIEGYWKESDDKIKLESQIHPGVFLERIIPAKTNYPIPIPNVLSQEEAKIIYNLILEKEKTATKVAYMGDTFSRITGEILGNLEYEKDEWIWPGDFAKHYVLENKVKPTDEFLKYIGYEQSR